jgi:hypothetical protein
VEIRDQRKLKRSNLLHLKSKIKKIKNKIQNLKIQKIKTQRRIRNRKEMKHLILMVILMIGVVDQVMKREEIRKHQNQLQKSQIQSKMLVLITIAIKVINGMVMMVLIITEME